MLRRPQTVNKYWGKGASRAGWTGRKLGTDIGHAHSLEFLFQPPGFFTFLVATGSLVVVMAPPKTAITSISLRFQTLPAEMTSGLIRIEEYPVLGTSAVVRSHHSQLLQDRKSTKSRMSSEFRADSL